MRLVIIVLMCFSANSACNASSLVEFSKATGLFICLVITSLILQYTVSGFRRSCPPVSIKGRVKVSTKPKRVKADKEGKTHSDFLNQPNQWGGREDNSFFEDLD